MLPGFVAILVKERIYEVPDEQQPFDRVLQTLYYSLLVYAIPVVIAVVAGADRADFERLFQGEVDLRFTACLAIGVTLVLPMVIAYTGRRWMISDARQTVLGALKVSITHRTPSSWDYAWEDGEPCLVVATLKSGEVVGGYYGPNSHSGYGSQHRDLFLEERWSVEQHESGTMRLEPLDRTLGAWLAADDLVVVERYAVSDEQVEEIRGEVYEVEDDD